MEQNKIMNRPKVKHNDIIPEICPLTEEQKGIYLECINDPESVKYNVCGYFELPNSIDVNRFVEAVKTVVRNHKVFMINIISPDGIPSMILREKEITFTEKANDDIDNEIKNFIRPFDFENDALFRFELLHCKGRLIFLYDIHHIITDGTSFDIFIKEIADVYAGKEIEKEELTIFDISAYESEIKKSEEYKIAKEYFRNKFEGIDCDSSIIPDVLTENGSDKEVRVSFEIDSELSHEKVESFVKENNITENAFFLGAFSYAIAKFNGMNESSLCTVNTGRIDKGLSSTFGMFVKTLPVYSTFDSDTTVKAFLENICNDYYYTKKNSFVPFDELVAEYGISNEITFVFQSRLFNETEIGDGKTENILADTGELVCNFDVMLMKNESGYSILAHYNASLYSKELIDSLLEMYSHILLGMLTSQKLADIDLVCEKNRQLMDSINATQAEYRSDKTVVELFREQVKKTPENICLVYCDQKYTYREVDSITDILAKNLVKNGVGKEKVVGVLIPRCEYMLIASLGILKAGGAYLPLDPTYPAERLNFMMKDSGAVLLISSPELDGIITSDFEGIRISTEDILKLEDCDVQLGKPDVSDLFVMLYTSGSTGLPKGVMFEHSNTLVTAEWVKKYFNIDETSRVTSYASYGFDAHAFDIYPVIISGAQIHIISEDIRLDLLALRDYYNKNGITHTVMTTQVGRQFALMGGFETLKHISVAGEKLTPVYVDNGYNLYNLYGPTEGSVVTSAFKIDKKYKDVPIGKAVDNLKIYIVDKDKNLLPTGAVGELWISGPHVTRGYINRPDKTAQAYGENPFCTEKGYERVYRTGDIVRLMADGNLQFVGRRDGQVKIRGFRVELTEIEEIIRRFPDIDDATVVAFDDPSGGKFVTAYIVSQKEISTEKLAEFIRGEKPPYMVPAVIMQIDSIPLTQNYKVNKRALPVPQRNVGEIIPPQNEVQQKIFDVVSEVIGHSDFGIDTDIYEAGLTSIGAVKLNVSIAKAFDVAMRIADLKTYSTIIKLEKFISSVSESESYEILEDYPLTQTQNGIFVECSANPNSVIYNIPVMFRIDSELDIEKLRQAVKATINAHPYIKTYLRLDDSGEIRAVRNDSAEPVVDIIKCIDIPDKSELVKPFELLSDRLYRIAIYQTEQGNYLFMDLHHIISDGTSEAIIISDIEKAYSGQTLEIEKFTGFEAALEEEKLRNSEKYNNAKEYYDSIFKGCDAECLPQKAPETTEEKSASYTYNCSIKAADVEKYCEENKFTLNAFFNAVFSFVLSKFDHREEIIYTTVYNGRNDSRLASAVTMLVKTIPVYANITENKKTNELIGEIQNQLINSFSNDIYSFAEISRAYNIKSDIMFIYQGDDFKFDKICGKQAEYINIVPDAAKAPITINIYKNNGSYEIVADYRANIFSAVFTKSLLSSVEEAVKCFLNNEILKEMTIVSSDCKKIIDEANDTQQDFINVSVNRLIESHAKKTPDKLAVKACGRELTFDELNRLANRIAHSLYDCGVKQNNIIGMIFDRTVEISYVELGILKAGGAFLAILPSYPDDRIDFCLTNAESPIVITTQEIKESRPELFSEDKPYIVKTLEELLQNTNEENLNLDIDTNSLAYCIYTSGSTGTPKGVMIEHHNFANIVQTDNFPYEYYTGPKSGKTALALSSISFDMSIFDNLMQLCNGISVIIATDDDIHNPLALAKLMKENHVELMSCTPSFINNYVTMKEFFPALEHLKTIVVGAEAFPGALYNELKKINPEMNVINGYGPTECTITCCAKILNDSKNVTIGKPLSNTKFYVMDKFGNVLPPYACGELIICGECVGRGYIGLPEKNKASFFTFNGIPAYHSGDLVRMNCDGEIEFCGRIDNQVKLRGFRVELDEIENVICSFSGVKQSKVVVRNNGTEDYLAGFFTAENVIEIEELTGFLKTKLTYYMVPDIIMQLEQMPLTQSGKIDKKALPESAKKSKKAGKKRAPKKSLEQQLCEIFKSVLNLEEVYADDNFFELGGTSLSAAKVTMMLMSENIEVKYGDIFDNPTPENLAEFIHLRDAKAKSDEKEKTEKAESTTRDTLKYNVIKYSNQVRREMLGNVLLTGAVGFLGIHILRELINSEEGHIWCLVRKGKYENPLSRLKTMLVYYFSESFEDALENRITVIDADITDSTLQDTLSDVDFDTVINCAACVKHFADDDILERINVHGVENLINLCQDRNAKMIQISTVSVPGIHTQESWEKQIRMHENELFVIDDMDNKYGISKYHAELKMFDAIDNGLKGKVIRVGNLMGRHSDGEFQVNLETNMFLSGIRGFALMGKYPISHMIDPMKFSPIDCTARAVVLLAGTNDMFTAFNVDNRYGFDEMKVIDACNRNGIKIVPTEDEAYYNEFRQKLGDERVNAKLNGLAAYDIKDAHAVETDNLFTTNILYRIGFSWPLVDDAYLDRAINSILTLDYFNVDEVEQ